MRKWINTTGLVLVISALVLCAAGFRTSARDISPMVTNAEKAILSNQEYIQEYRPIVEEWNKRKENNVLQIGILQANGFEFDWATNRAVPLP